MYLKKPLDVLDNIIIQRGMNYQIETSVQMLRT